eukprot:951791-Karenia_brevis.AAC.1
MSAIAWRKTAGKLKKLFTSLTEMQCTFATMEVRAHMRCSGAYSGKGFTLGNWARAVEQGKTMPKSDEALQMLKDMNEKCTQEQLAVIEVGLDWTPMIPGDGHVVGSLVQKHNCEAC